MYLGPWEWPCCGSKLRSSITGQPTFKPILWCGIPDGDTEFRNLVRYKWASVSTLSNDLCSREWPGNLSITKSLITSTVLFAEQINLLPAIHWWSWQFNEIPSKVQPIKSSRDNLYRNPAGTATRNGPCGETYSLCILETEIQNWPNANYKIGCGHFGIPLLGWVLKVFVSWYLTSMRATRHPN